MHIGIILDGNRRWAKEKNKTTKQGHLAGAKNLEKLVPHIFKRGVKVLSVYAFSTENFQRSEVEVKNIFLILSLYLDKLLKESKKNGIKVLISGNRDLLDENINQKIDKLEIETSVYSDKILNICLAYGGREELLQAFKRMYKDIENGLDLNNLTSEDINKYLYQELPPLDFIIRTSGEERLSNFMIYQAAYSEFYFPKTYFPDFDEEKFDEALEEYEKRQRRYGK